MDENSKMRALLSMLNTLRMTTECYCAMNNPPKEGYKSIAQAIDIIKEFLQS